MERQLKAKVLAKQARLISGADKGSQTRSFDKQFTWSVELEIYYTYSPGTGSSSPLNE
jgi:hypothetical protein